MKSSKIRESYIKYFENQGHVNEPSASLIPSGDPTLLFTSAGMVPFKAYFMGEQVPPSTRMTSIQKSFRTTDIDEVGDHKHLTFFEMLGNFSFGDYFKEESITYAWEVCTKVFGLNPDKFYITVHLDDDEAYDYWHHTIGIPIDRLYRYGNKDNWWGPAGEEGPTGPCSELHYDTGAVKGCGDLLSVDELKGYETLENEGKTVKWGPGCHPNCDNCERFVELWNLVFTQFYQDTDGQRTNLPSPNIDTGMGLERVTAVLQDKSNVYETDLFSPIINSIEDLTGSKYGGEESTDYSIRVVAEHGRAATFLIGDGVIPGNEGRGYVLRRIIRRAIRHGRLLGLTDPFMTVIARAVADNFGDIYPELLEQSNFISDVISNEEERFGLALQNGLPILENGFMTARKLLKTRSSNSPIIDLLNSEEVKIPDAILSRLIPVYEGLSKEDLKVLSGLEIFILYDTYGFPPELTSEICETHDFVADIDGFNKEMEAQRSVARNTDAFTGSMAIDGDIDSLDLPSTTFLGYEMTETETEVLAILTDNGAQSALNENETGKIVLADTVFYAEGGGQVGDKGYIKGPAGVFQVIDTKVLIAGITEHVGKVISGQIKISDAAICQIDLFHRQGTSTNHSATHMIHAALRDILGTHVKQAGSLVTADRLRFDFSHIGPMKAEEIQRTQRLVNEKVRSNLDLTVNESSYTDALAGGALAFFDERYGENVRVVSMSDNQSGERFSVEVCGGTHLSTSGEIGTVLILGESGVGSGMRRVEAITGQQAETLMIEKFNLLDVIAAKFQSPVSELESRIENFMEERDSLRHSLENLQKEATRFQAEGLLEHVQDMGGIKLISTIVDANSVDELRTMCDSIRNAIHDVLIVLASNISGSPVVVVMCSDNAKEKGFRANDMALHLGKIIEGGGGGTPDFAQAGGKRTDLLPSVIDTSIEYIKAQL